MDEIDDFYLGRLGYVEWLLSARSSLLHRTADSNLAVNNLIGLARAYTRLGDSKEAVKYLGAALDICTGQNLRFKEGIALGSLGPAYFDLGRYDEAIECWERSIRIAREGAGDLRGEASRLIGLAVVYRELGDFYLAIELLQDAIDAILKLDPARKEIGRSVRGTGLNNLGDIYRLLAKYAEAENCFLEALEISREEKRMESAS